jgi:membrane-bound lytic murein transglycosylase A
VKLRLAGGLAAALMLAACATTPVPPGPPPPSAPPPPVAEAPRELPLQALPGWAEEDHAAAFAAWRGACGRSQDPAAMAACGEARALPLLDDQSARRFFEARFVAQPWSGDGVLTGYYAPVYDARRAPDAEFCVPLRPKPAQVPDLDRAAIEATPEPAPLAWMRPEDLFFLQVQGSGTLVFEDGQRLKALYAGNNGKPFFAIAQAMREQGLLPPDQVSAQSIHDWLAAHRGPDADALMRLNPRYVYFKLGPDDGKPPVGAANVPLPGGRAVAVDPAYHGMGELLWVDGEAPTLIGAFPRYQRLVMALDVGGAIKGPIRADLYVGEGHEAGVEAGRIRHSLRLWRLAPRPLS